MKLIFTLLGLSNVLLIWSAIDAHDYFTWFLEILPTVLGLLVLVFTFNRFRFSN